MSTAATAAMATMNKVAVVLSVARAKRAMRPGRPGNGPLSVGIGSTPGRSLGSPIGHRRSKAAPASLLGADEATRNTERSAAPELDSAILDFV